MEITKDKMEKTNEGLEQTVKDFKRLNEEMHNASELIIPLMRDYLKEIQSVRMAFTREIQDILRSASELHELKKILPDLEELCKTLMIMRDLATDKNIEVMRKLVK